MFPVKKKNTLTFRREQLKVGSGVDCCTDTRLNTELVMEAVIVISNMSIQNTSCLREYGDKTEVPLLVLELCFCSVLLYRFSLSAN